MIVSNCYIALLFGKETLVGARYNKTDVRQSGRVATRENRIFR